MDANPATKTMCRVVVKGSDGSADNYIDLDIVGQFSLAHFITQLRATGFLLNERIYIPVHEIRCVFLYEQGKEDEVFKRMMPEKGTLQ